MWSSFCWTAGGVIGHGLCAWSRVHCSASGDISAFGVEVARFKLKLLPWRVCVGMSSESSFVGLGLLTGQVRTPAPTAALVPCHLPAIRIPTTRRRIRRCQYSSFSGQLSGCQWPPYCQWQLYAISVVTVCIAQVCAISMETRNLGYDHRRTRSGLFCFRGAPLTRCSDGRGNGTQTLRFHRVVLRVVLDVWTSSESSESESTTRPESHCDTLEVIVGYSCYFVVVVPGEWCQWFVY